MRPDTDNRWRDSWRRYWAPALSTAELEALAEALAANDARLRQRVTVYPLPTRLHPDCLCREGDAITCAVWLSRGPMTSAAVLAIWRERFDTFLQGNDEANHYLLWYDGQSWEDTVRPGLLGEVSRSLGMRALNQQDMTIAEPPIVVLIAS